MPRHAPRVCLLAFALAAAAFPAEPGALKIDYPLPGALFPPEFPSPTILWRDPTPAAAAWTAHLAFLNGAPARTIALAGTPMTPGEIDPRAVGPTNELPRLTPEQAASRAWKPDAATWAAIKENGGATLVITGHVARGAEALSRGEVTIRISADRVGAPIFYRDVPLMPSETEKGVIKPLAAAAVPLIAWRLRDLGSARSRVVMEGVHSCANCHSASADGKTMGMDIDGPQNDKGLYALFSIQP